MNSTRLYYQGAFALRGLVALIFGVFVLWKPGIAVGTLVVLFSINALIGGVMSCLAALVMPDHRGLFLIGGLFGILVGIVTFTHPGFTLLTLVSFIAVLILVEGAVFLTAGFAGSMLPGFNWLMVLMGGVNVLFSILLLTSPGAAVVTLINFLGLYAVFSGISMEVQAWQLQSGQRATTTARVSG